VCIATVDIDPEGLNRIAALPDLVAMLGDARDPEVLAELFAKVDERWGRVDTLVNVVGGTFRSEFTDTSPRGWDALLRTNLMHVLHACSLAVPRMRAGAAGGSIVNLTTIECHRAAPGFAVYSAAKAAVEQFARTLAVEVAPDGIRVNNVAPDFTPTPNMQRLSSRGGPVMSDEAIRVGIPMGRAGETADVSNCVVFLASALSSYVTGTTIHPDGGTFASSGWFNWPDHGWGNNLPPYLVPHLGDDGHMSADDGPGA
jgi:3-oxoacyl-[acyl-carrier protein] reductase